MDLFVYLSFTGRSKGECGGSTILLTYEIFLVCGSWGGGGEGEQYYVTRDHKYEIRIEREMHPQDLNSIELTVIKQ